MNDRKIYLGDGVYAEFDGYDAIILSTTNGHEVTDEIFLEPEVYHSLVQWVKSLKEAP